MELHRVILTKSNLVALPQAERSLLLLLLGHASNEINVLSKLILMVTRKDEAPSQIANNVEAGQACVLLRVLVGQLHEAWELFKKRVQADRPLFDKYVPQLDGDGAAALGNLNRHFGAGSPVTKIRDVSSDKDGHVRRCWRGSSVFEAVPHRDRCVPRHHRAIRTTNSHDRAEWHAQC